MIILKVFPLNAINETKFPTLNCFLIFKVYVDYVFQVDSREFTCKVNEPPKKLCHFEFFSNRKMQIIFISKTISTKYLVCILIIFSKKKLFILLAKRGSFFFNFLKTFRFYNKLIFMLFRVLCCVLR